MTPLLIISALILAMLLLALSFVDIKSYRLPNKFTFLLIASGLLHAYILGLPLKDHIIGAAIGYAVFFTVEQVFLKPVSYTHLTLPTIYSV